MDAQDILADLFKMIFSIIKWVNKYYYLCCCEINSCTNHVLLSHSNEQSSKVKNYMLEILSSLMQEGESLSQEIIDVVLMNIVEPAKVLNLWQHTSNSV